MFIIRYEVIFYLYAFKIQRCVYEIIIESIFIDYVYGKMQMFFLNIFKGLFIIGDSGPYISGI